VETLKVARASGTPVSLRADLFLTSQPVYRNTVLQYRIPILIMVQRISAKRIRANIARGSAELVILSLLAEQSLYGFEISRRIKERTDGALRFELASLYPMLYDLERRRLVEGQWQPSSTGRDRRYYSLTRKGKAKLAPLRREWRSFFQALDGLAGVNNA